MQADQPTVTTPSIPALAIPLLSLASFASAVSLRVTDPLLPTLTAEFGISLGHAAYVITAFSIAYGLSQLFFGPIGDRHGKYFVIGCACIACAASAAVCGLASNFPFLVMARLLSGATAAAVIPLSMAWIGDVVPYEERQPVLARFLIGQILGVSAGALLGGFAADAHRWRLPFLGIALLFVLNSVGLLWLNRRLPEHARLRRVMAGSVAKRMTSEFYQVLLQSWARAILITVFLEGFFLFGAFAFIASHLHHAHGLSLARAGALVMLFGFGGVLFALTSARLVGSLGERGLALCGGVLMAGALFTISVAPVWWWVVPACFLAGLGYYMLHNTLQINATQMAPERRGAAVSAFASCFFLGQSAGVAVAGIAVVRVGVPEVLIAGAVGVLVVAGNFYRGLKGKMVG